MISEPPSAGVVRRARRPAGWSAPGPPPAGATDAGRLGPRPGEDLCYLAGDWRILQRLDGQRWSLDDLVTAWCAAEQMPASVLDLGCGIGAVLMLLAWRWPRVRAVGIEAYCLAAARWLAPGGRFVACAAAAQVRRVAEAAAAAGLHLTRRLDVIPRAGKPALFSVHTMRAGRGGGEPALDPPLVVRDAAGRRTPMFRALRARMGMPP
ncbi:MAG TPA: hypothetical protein VE997_04480 [Candidatus Limnocylindria bacterium]|nr:hypothetical protein [Candidatus Limnocylindria bacterium]